MNLINAKPIKINPHNYMDCEHTSCCRPATKLKYCGHKPIDWRFVLVPNRVKVGFVLASMFGTSRIYTRTENGKAICIGTHVRY